MHARLITDELGITNTLLTNRGFIECKEAECLEVVEVGVNGRDYLLIPAAAEAWRSLKTAAFRDNVSVFIVSAFRSIEQQADIIRRKLEAGATIEEILTVSAPPGFSEHHTGRAVDVSTIGTRSLEVEFDQSPAFEWLMEHAREFGFYQSYPVGNPHGYQYEPWHWCFHEL